MKKLIINYRALLLLFAMVLQTSLSYAENKIRFAPVALPDFSLSIQNQIQTANNKVEFDIFLLGTGPNQPFILASYQYGILFNSLVSTGVITVTYINTNSGLNVFLQASAPTNTATKIGNQTLLESIGGAAFTPGQGSTISTIGNGTLMTHFIVTSSVPFTVGSTLDLVFTLSTYPTRVAEFINNVSTDLVVTPGTNAIIVGNPVLNASPIAYTVSGSGSYCQNGAGLPVGLSSSDLGVNYQLYSGANAVGTPVAGTGSAISFGNQTVGTYTVTATNTTTLITASMTGNAIISADPLITPSVSIAASANPSSTGVSVTFTATPTNGGTAPTYQWYVNSIAVGTVTSSNTYSYVPTNSDLVSVSMNSNATPCLVGSPVTSNVITQSVSFGTSLDQTKMKIDIYSRDKNILVTCSQKAKQVSIYNSLGSLIMMENNVSGLKTFNMNNFPTEYYFVKIITDNDVYSQKVLLKL